MNRFCLALAICLTLALSGCSVWDSITAYFNTFYNAERIFRDAEDELWNLPDLRYSGRDLMVPYITPANTRTKLTSVIEKCSKLLQYHPDSKLVDDALMMIGKASLYQNDFTGAERKFKELIDRYPDGDYALEARYLLAVTTYKMARKPEALAIAQEARAAAEKEGEDELVAAASAVIAQVLYDNEEYKNSRAQFLSSATTTDNRDRKANTYLKIAHIDSLLRDFEQAEDDYRRASEWSNNYLLEYRGAIGAVRMISVQGDADRALTELENMRFNTNYRDFYGEIDLEIANVRRDTGDIEGAIEQYRYVDTAYVRTDPSSNANYQLGLTYERMMRLDSARAVFVRGRAAAPNSRVAPLMARRADYLNRYFILRSDLAKFDSVKAVLLAPPPAEEKPDSAATDTSAAARARPKPATPQKPALTLDSVNVRLANTKNELASLFYLTMNIPDSAAYWYRTLISDHPQSPVIPRAMFSLAEIMGHDTLASTQPADSIYHAIIDRYPHSEYAAEARRILGLAPIVSATDTAGVLLRDAEQKYLAGDYAGAIAGYRTVVDAHPTSTYAPRAQYAVGWLYEEYTTEVDSAIENYRRLMSQYPTDPLAYRIQPRLFEVDQYRKAIADSIAAVEREKAAAAARDSIAALMKDSVAVAPADSAATVPPEDQLPPAADTTGGTRAVPDTVKNLRQRN